MAKERLHKKKIELGLPKKFEPTDIIPLVNYCWERGFGRVDYAKKAIAKRGWNPPNRALLCDLDILKTKPNDLPTSPTTEDDTTVASVSPASAAASVALSVNADNGKAASVFDFINESRDKSKTTERQLEKKRKSDKA